MTGHTKRPLGYLDGLGTGLGLFGLLAIGWLAQITPDVERMYRDVGPGAALPAITKLVLSPAWRIGVPAAIVAAIVAAHVWRPRYLLLGLAVVTLGVAIFWYVATYQPIFQVAGNIR